MLLASHNMSEVERLCERVIIMKRGRIEDDDTPARLLIRYGRETLEEVFLDVARGRGQARGGGAMSAPRPAPSRCRRRTASRPWCCAMYTCCARRGRGMLELIYWPAVQLFVWGFLQLYITENAGFFARAGGVFIGAVLMWDVLFRGQLGFSVSFLEEMWSRNLSNLMISPLRPIEFVCALMIMSLIRLAIGMVPVTLLAIAFFGFNLYSLGLALAAFFMNLILTSWAVGIVVSGVLLRNGMGAETLAWTLMFVLMPITCVYYPVSVLPDWLQVVAWVLPPTYVFEGMRALLMEQQFRADLMVAGFRAQRALFRRRRVRVPAVAQERAPRRHAAADRRVGRRAPCSRSGLVAAQKLQLRANRRCADVN